MPRLLVHANEASAAQRRVYFHLVDATDGLTAETGEAGGQPQVSSDGGAWTNTGIGTLSSIGNGRYYADLTQTLVQTAGTLIETRYKSANTAECPGDSAQVVAFDPNDTLRLGLTALPNAAADAAGGLPISDAGGLDLDTLLARLDAAITTRQVAIWAAANSTVNLSATTIKTATDVEAATTSIQTDTNDIQSRLPAALVSGRMDSNMQAAASNVITASVIADGAIDRATFAADTGLQTIRSNTAQGGSSSSITLDASASSVDNFYNGVKCRITGGTGVGQESLLYQYNGTTKAAAVAPTWKTTPDNTSTFALTGTGAADFRLIESSISAMGSFNDFFTGFGDNGYVPVSLHFVLGTSINESASGRLAAAFETQYNVATPVFTNASVNQTGDSFARIGANGTSLSAIPWNASWDAEVQSECTDALNAYDPPTNAEMVARTLAAADYATNTDLDALITTVGVAGAGLTALATQASVNLIAADLPTRITKNVALNNYMFKMVDETDHVTAETGLTITATRSLDGAAFASCANNASEVSGGWYKINLATTDLNGDVVVLKFTATGADTAEFVILTQPT